MEPGHSFDRVCGAGHGVLSQIARQHPEHLAAADPPPSIRLTTIRTYSISNGFPPGAAAPGARARVDWGLAWVGNTGEADVD